MTAHTHQAAPTQYVKAHGIRFAYRRFGKSGSVPLLFNMHFTGAMDHWDPTVSDGTSATCPYSCPKAKNAYERA
jgi:hypothetical protein